MDREAERTIDSIRNVFFNITNHHVIVFLDSFKRFVSISELKLVQLISYSYLSFLFNR